MYGSIALPLRTARVGTPRRAGGDLHKAARPFVFSTSHFAMPMIPTFPPGERHRAGLSAGAIVAKRKSSISTNRAWKGCRDQRRAERASADWSSPIRGAELERLGQKQVAISLYRRRCLDR